MTLLSFEISGVDIYSNGKLSDLRCARDVSDWRFRQVANCFYHLNDSVSVIRMTFVISKCAMLLHNWTDSHTKHFRCEKRDGWHKQVLSFWKLHLVWRFSIEWSTSAHINGLVCFTQFGMFIIGTASACRFKVDLTHGKIEVVKCNLGPRLLKTEGMRKLGTVQQGTVLVILMFGIVLWFVDGPVWSVYDLAFDQALTGWTP